MIIKLLFFHFLTSFWYPLSIAKSIHLPSQKESVSYRIELSAPWEPCTPGSPLLSGFEVHSISWVASLLVSLLTYQGLFSHSVETYHAIPYVRTTELSPGTLQNPTSSEYLKSMPPLPLWPQLSNPLDSLLEQSQEGAVENHTARLGFKGLGIWCHVVFHSFIHILSHSFIHSVIPTVLGIHKQMLCGSYLCDLKIQLYQKVAAKGY